MNPYIYDQPLTRQELFVNRRDEIVWVTSRLAARHPQSVSIIGEPGIGKTSLLNWIAHETSRADYLSDPTRSIVLVLPLKEQAPDHPEAFFTQVSQMLASTGHGGMLPSAEGFRHYVEELQAAGQKLVLFLDDFEWVTIHRAFPPEFFALLRAMANTYDVAYVTTSVDQLQTLCASPSLGESPFFNIFTPVTLLPLTEDDAKRLVQEPAIAAGVPFATDEVETIVRLAGGHPYVLQLTAHVAFAARATGQVTMEEVTEQVVQEARRFLQGLWDERFTPPQRAVLQMLGAGKTVRGQDRYAADELIDRGYLQPLGEHEAIRSRLIEAFVNEQRGGRFWKRWFG